MSGLRLIPEQSHLIGTFAELQLLQGHEIVEAFRIVEEKDGEYYSLFHGTNRSRKLPRGIWLKADKKVVRDGSCATYYESGFHVLTSEEEAEKFFKKLFRIHKNRKVIKVFAIGLKPKKHSRHKVFLADEMLIP